MGGSVQNRSSTHLNICAAFSALKRPKEVGCWPLWLPAAAAPVLWELRSTALASEHSPTPRAISLTQVLLAPGRLLILSTTAPPLPPGAEPRGASHHPAAARAVGAPPQLPGAPRLLLAVAACARSACGIFSCTLHSCMASIPFPPPLPSHAALHCLPHLPCSGRLVHAGATAAGARRGPSAAGLRQRAGHGVPQCGGAWLALAGTVLFGRALLWDGPAPWTYLPNSLLQLPRCLYASLRLLSCTFCLNTNAG